MDKNKLAPEIITHIFPGQKCSASIYFCYIIYLKNKTNNIFAFYKYNSCLSLVNVFFNKHGFGEYDGISPTVIRGKKTVPAMVKRYDETNMQTASFISGHCVHHSFPFTPFDPDLLVLLLFFVRLHTINVCHLLHDQNGGPSLTGSPPAALSPCIWATGSSTGGTGTSSLIICPYPSFNSPLEVILII